MWVGDCYPGKDLMLVQTEMLEVLQLLCVQIALQSVHGHLDQSNCGNKAGLSLLLGRAVTESGMPSAFHL